MRVEELLKQAIVTICDLPPDLVAPDTPLTDLGVDSLAVAQVIVELETELDCEFPVHLLRRLDAARTVGDVSAELEAALAERTPRA